MRNYVEGPPKRNGGYYSVRWGIQPRVHTWEIIGYITHNTAISKKAIIAGTAVTKPKCREIDYEV